MILGLIFLCISLAAICEAIMDTLAHHFEESSFKNLDKNWWNPIYSGNNKWKNGDKKQGEKFFLSSTLLVGFTEAWHTFKTIRTFLIFLTLGLMEYHFMQCFYITLCLRILFGIYFTITYRSLKDE